MPINYQAWFSNELNSMKTIPDGPNMPTSPNGLLSPGAFEPATAFTAVTPFLPPLPGDPSGQLKLPLSREMAMRFQALIRTYDQLSCLILDTLRIDIRCRAMYYLDASMRHVRNCLPIAILRACAKYLAGKLQCIIRGSRT
jgi:exocyst complex component 4